MADDQNQMEEQQQWLSIAAVVLVIVGLGFFLYRQSRQTDDVEVVETGDGIEERAEELAQQMQFEVPEDAQRATLRDVSGGDGVGVATLSEDEEVKMFSFLASLPEPSAGQFYEGYLVKTGEPETVTYAGKLREAKGGWLLEYDSAEDLSEFSTVRITRETADDRQPEETVLEGEFTLQE